MNLNLHIDKFGQVSGFRHHDGAITHISFVNKEEIEIGVMGSSQGRSTVRLSGVDFFVTNNLREGNTIDRLFLWHMDAVPTHIQSSMRKNFDLTSLEPFGKGSSENFVFHLQCSFGAEIFAVISSLAAFQSESSEEE